MLLKLKVKPTGHSGVDPSGVGTRDPWKQLAHCSHGSRADSERFTVAVVGFTASDSFSIGSPLKAV